MGASVDHVSCVCRLSAGWGDLRCNTLGDVLHELESRLAAFETAQAQRSAEREKLSRKNVKCLHI